MRRISVLPSADVVESLIFPLHRMNTPRGACPSTKSVAPRGYTADDVIAARLSTATGGRLQNSLSSRCAHERQFSMISRLYGARTDFLLPAPCYRGPVPEPAVVITASTG